MPTSVLDALTLILYGLVAVSGVLSIARTGVTQRWALIVALALAVGPGGSD